MKITNIRLRDEKPTEDKLKLLARELRVAMTKAGFQTDVETISSSGINIALGGSTFKVDPDVHGHNARVGYYDGNGLVIQRTGGKGFVRTTLPTWEQRVEFNHIINRVLDKHHVTADVRAAGNFVVRTQKEGGIKNWTWDTNRAGALIVPEREAVTKFATVKKIEGGRRPAELSKFTFVPFRPQDNDIKEVSNGH